jgi:hypothetical protein
MISSHRVTPTDSGRHEDGWRRPTPVASDLTGVPTFAGHRGQKDEERQWEYESSNCFSHNHATALHVWLFNTNIHPRVEIYYCWDHSVPHFILSDWNRKSKSTKSCNGRCCSSVHRAWWRRSSSWSQRGLPRPAAAIRKLRQRANRRVQAHLMEQCHCYSLCVRVHHGPVLNAFVPPIA